MSQKWRSMVVVIALLLTAERTMAVLNCADDNDAVPKPLEVFMPSCATVKFPSDVNEPGPFDFQVKVTNDTGHRIIVPRFLAWSALMVSDRNGSEADYEEPWLIDVRGIRSDYFRQLEPDESVTLTYSEQPLIQPMNRDRTDGNGVVLNMLLYTRPLPAGLYSMVYNDAISGDSVVLHKGRQEYIRDVFPDCVCDVRLWTRPVIIEVHGD